MPTGKSTHQKATQSKRDFATMPKDKQREIAKKRGEHSPGGSGPSKNEE